jgi:hypothetical protein
MGETVLRALGRVPGGIFVLDQKTEVHQIRAEGGDLSAEILMIPGGFPEKFFTGPFHGKVPYI